MAGYCPLADVRPLRLAGEKKKYWERKKGALSEALPKDEINGPNFLAA
jgi:hypothetical protein